MGRQSAASQFSSWITATTDRNMHTWMLAVNGYGIDKLGDLSCKWGDITGKQDNGVTDQLNVFATFQLCWRQFMVRWIISTTVAISMVDVDKSSTDRRNLC
jgi:hypothetical protein